VSYGILTSVLISDSSLQNQSIGILIVRGGNILGQQTGLWSTKTIVPKAAWHWGGDSSVVYYPFGAPGGTPSYICLPPTWGCTGGDCLIPWFLCDKYGPASHILCTCVASAEFKFCRLGKHFYWTNRVNKKSQFKVALKRYLNTHSFYSVNEFLMFENDSWCIFKKVFLFSYTING
jgi:hypothetical protein